MAREMPEEERSWRNKLSYRNRNEGVDGERERYRQQFRQRKRMMVLGGG